MQILNFIERHKISGLWIAAKFKGYNFNVDSSFVYSLRMDSNLETRFDFLLLNMQNQTCPD